MSHADGLEMSAGGAMAPERVDFRAIRFAGHEDHFGGGDEIRRQLRRPVGHDRVAIEVEVEQLALDGVAEEIVPFVDNDPVWCAGAAPHDVESRQHRTDVLEFGVVLQRRQVDHHASIRISQRVEQRARRGRTDPHRQHPDAR